MPCSRDMLQYSKEPVGRSVRRVRAPAASPAHTGGLCGQAQAITGLQRDSILKPEGPCATFAVRWLLYIRAVNGIRFDRQVSIRREAGPIRVPGLLRVRPVCPGVSNRNRVASPPPGRTRGSAVPPASRIRRYHSPWPASAALALEKADAGIGDVLCHERGHRRLQRGPLYPGDRRLSKRPPGDPETRRLPRSGVRPHPEKPVAGNGASRPEGDRRPPRREARPLRVEGSISGAGAGAPLHRRRGQPEDQRQSYRHPGGKKPVDCGGGENQGGRAVEVSVPVDGAGIEILRGRQRRRGDQHSHRSGLAAARPGNCRRLQGQARQRDQARLQGGRGRHLPGDRRRQHHPRPAADPLRDLQPAAQGSVRDSRQGAPGTDGVHDHRES